MKSISSFNDSKTLLRSYGSFDAGQKGSIKFRVSVIEKSSVNGEINKDNFTYSLPE